MFFDDMTIEIARLVRECTAKAEARVRQGQLGEAFRDLPAPPEGELQQAA